MEKEIQDFITNEIATQFQELIEASVISAQRRYSLQKEDVRRWIREAQWPPIEEWFSKKSKCLQSKISGTYGKFTANMKTRQKEQEDYIKELEKRLSAVEVAYKNVTLSMAVINSVKKLFNKQQ